MVRLWIWTALVLGSETAAAVQSWAERASAESLRVAFGNAMVERSDESLAALQAAAADTEAYAVPLLVLGVVATLAMIGWLHSAAVYVDRGRLGYLRHGTGWAIGAWFVPFLNLVRVPSITADVFRAARTSPPAGLVVGIWWLAWIGDVVVARLASASADTASTPADIQSVISMMSLSDAVAVASAIITVLLVLLVVSGLQNTRSLLTSSYEFQPETTGGFPAGHWGTPVEPVADGVPAADGRFGPAPVPEPRFGVPAYDAPTGPRATSVGPPEPWLAAPAPTGGVAPAPAPGSWTPEPQAVAAPVVPVAPPAPAPAAAPATPAPGAPEPGSPYPSGGVFYPQ